uniref:6-phosphofructokinase n=1 Tax=Arundo donax TaxID=35708 RepID=A0A0A9HZK5_ARUDO
MQISPLYPLRSPCCWPPYGLLWPHRCPGSGSSAGWLKTAALPTSCRLCAPCSELILPSVARTNFEVMLIGKVTLREKENNFVGIPYANPSHEFPQNSFLPDGTS